MSVFLYGLVVGHIVLFAKVVGSLGFFGLNGSLANQGQFFSVPEFAGALELLLPGAIGIFGEENGVNNETIVAGNLNNDSFAVGRNVSSKN